MSEKYAQIMTTFPLFEGYTPHGVTGLIERGRIKEFAEGAILFREGDPADAVTLVLTGEAEVSVDRHGKPLKLDTIGPGRMVGELAVLGGTRRVASARATRPMAVLQWTEAEFRQLIAHDGDLSQRIFRELARVLGAEQEALVASLAAVKESGPHVR